MNDLAASRATASAQLAALRQRFDTLAPRERALVVLAAVLVVVMLLWLVLVQPAIRTVRSAPAALEQLDAELQDIQRLAVEARQLQALPAVPPDTARAALNAATTRLGGGARIAFQGDRATLTLDGATGEALRGWLAEARSAARARPLEARLTRQGQGYAGTIVVAVGPGA